jgi:uncharacterized membrane protein
MFASILAILAGLIPLIASIVEALQIRRNDARERAVRLATIELKQTQADMAAVDAELDGVRDPQREPILLSPDDHL